VSQKNLCHKRTLQKNFMTQKNLRQFWRSCLGPLVYLLPKLLKLFGFPTVRLWVNWWRLFRKRAVRTKFDINVSIMQQKNFMTQKNFMPLIEFWYKNSHQFVNFKNGGTGLILLPLFYFFFFFPFFFFVCCLILHWSLNFKPLLPFGCHKIVINEWKNKWMNVWMNEWTIFHSCYWTISSYPPLFKSHQY
jgi:hypothetical protein